MEGIDDRHEYFNPYRASCDNCKNGFDFIKLSCKAFPGGIPFEILEGKNKHMKPVKEQGNSLIFSPK